MLGRRRPLLRAAAVGGGAYALGKRRARQEAQDAAYYDEPEPTGLSQEDMDELERLAQLQEKGVLTPEEFQAEKRKILSGS